MDLDKHEVVKKFNYPDEKDEWYRIKYLPVEDWDNYEKDIDAFQDILLDWGGIKAGGKAIKCTKETKELFFSKAADRVDFIFKTSQSRSAYSPNGEEFLIKLGESLATSRNGEKASQILTT